MGSRASRVPAIPSWELQLRPQPMKRAGETEAQGVGSVWWQGENPGARLSRRLAALTGRRGKGREGPCWGAARRGGRAGTRPCVAPPALALAPNGNAIHEPWQPSRGATAQGWPTPPHSPWDLLPSGRLPLGSAGARTCSWGPQPQTAGGGSEQLHGAPCRSLYAGTPLPAPLHPRAGCMQVPGPAGSSPPGV